MRRVDIRHCSLIRSVIEYASAVFANLPKYLSDALEGIQKRALRIILPNVHYDEALILSGLPSLEDRRAAACKSFMRNLKPSNPVFALAMSGRVTTLMLARTRYEAAGTIITKCVRQNDCQNLYL